jgi:hypothetical protein
MKERRRFGSVPLGILAAAIALGLISSACGRVEAPGETVKAAPAPAVWIDPATHLTWAAKDNGYDVTWEMAKTFCSNLTTGGYKWTLPTIDQIDGGKESHSGDGVYWAGENDHGHPIKGNIKITGEWLWSATPAGSGSAWGFFYFLGGLRSSVGTDSLVSYRALCVRRAGE